MAKLRVDLDGPEAEAARAAAEGLGMSVQDYVRMRLRDAAPDDAFALAAAARFRELRGDLADVDAAVDPRAA